MRIALALVSLLAAAASVPAVAGGEEKAVLATVRQLLDGWREGDVAKAGAVLHPEFREVTLHAEGDHWKLSAVARERLLGVLAKVGAGAWDDRLLAPTVHVDGPIAVVWSRYRFRTPSAEEPDAAHCGIETFQLYRIDARWTIVNFADTHADCRPDRH